MHRLKTGAVGLSYPANSLTPTDVLHGGESMVQSKLPAKVLRRVKLGIPVGLVLLVAAMESGSWLPGIVGLLVLLGVVWVLCSHIPTPADDEPWPWPADFRALAERMARPIDPTPRRVVPPNEKASEIAHVATSMEELTRLITDKPPAWTLAAFTSVLVQRRNALQGRLRTVSAGYQPDPWEMPISAQEYYALAHSAMVRIADFGSQTEKFLASPAFTGAIGDFGDSGSDADAVISVAHRLMDYHAVFLEQAEVILQTPVVGGADAFVEDMGSFAISLLVGYEKFILELCDRLAEAQELIPYANGKTIQLDAVRMNIALRDGLPERVLAYFDKFNQ